MLTSPLSFMNILKKHGVDYHFQCLWCIRDSYSIEKMSITE